MDLISRLKTYIDSHSIPITRFADDCGIPRPTLSQLLNGRNKKVSDEVISKIHAAYPSLSVIWLMFGEGPMETIAANLQQPSSISDAPQLSSSSATAADDHQAAGATTPRENQIFSPMIDFDHDFLNEDRLQPSTLNFASSAPAKPDLTTAATRPDPQAKPRPESITFNPDKGKRVISIVVYYDDKSYESFVPDSKPRTSFP